MRIRNAFLFTLGFGLTACNGSIGINPQTTIQGVEYTCAAATTALKTAIQFNAKMTPAQRATVTQASVVLDPVCSQPTVPTVSTTAQAALTGALTQLTTIATAVQK